MKINIKSMIVVAILIVVMFGLLIVALPPARAAGPWSLVNRSASSRIAQGEVVPLNSMATSVSLTIYVDASNQSGIEDGTQGHPFNTIQEGLGVANSGDIVQVAAGTYYERITLKNGVKLLGAGAEVTRIDGVGQNDSVVSASNVGPGTLLDGFTITHGTGKWIGGYTYGGGLYVSNSTLVLRNCIVTDNRASDGAGGIQVRVSTISIHNCTFSKNSGWWGGAITLTGTNAEIVGSIIDQSSAGYGGAILIAESSKVTVVNNLIMHTLGVPAIGIDDTAGIGGSSTVTITNNTIVDNLGNGIAWNRYGNGGSATIKNNILWGNNDDLVNVTATYSDIEDGDPGEGNISTYPLFVDPANGDYRLRRISLCVDAGTNDGAPLADFEGDPRPVDGDGDGIEAVDIGADEFIPLGFSTKAVNRSGAPRGDSLTYTITLRNAVATVITDVQVTDILPLMLTYLDNSLTATGGSYGYNSGVITWTGSINATGIVTLTFGAVVSPTAPIGTSIVNPAVISGGGTVITRTATANVVLAGPWYVKPSGNDSNDCLSPAAACATINGTLNKPGFVAGHTIRVAVGTYIGTGNEVVLINQSATLSGGWDAAFTTQSGMSTIDGQGTRRGITVNSDATATVERFVVQNSDLSGCCGAGAGVLNDGTLTLDRVHVRNNSITSGGGGIYNNGALTLNNSAVTGNGGSNSCVGGIFNNGGIVTLNNSTVSGNRDAGSAYCAPIAGIANSNGLLALNNSTVSDNMNGGLWSFPTGSTTLQNSIIAGNRLENGSPYDCHEDVGGSFISLGYNFIGAATCTITGTIGDQIGSSSSPLIAKLFPLTGSPGYHPLLQGSPAIDAGNPDGCRDNLGNLLTTDQRGVARVGRCDIGAFEFDLNNNPIRQIFLPGVARNFCTGQFFDDFGNSASGWPIGDDGNVRREYLNGEYRILVRNTNWWAGARPSITVSSNYSVDVDVRNATSVYGSYGIIFGLSDDWSQFYTFEIDPDGFWVIWRFNSGSGWTLLAVGSSGSIATGTATNHLRLQRDGSSIAIYANGQLLTSISDGTYTGVRRVGLIVTSYDQAYVDARFDNFDVCGVAPTASAASATPAEAVAQTASTSQGQNERDAIARMNIDQR